MATTESQVNVSTWSPPGWMNASMKLALRTPGLQSVMGKKLALISFTGRKSGKAYTTPVTYYRAGPTVTILTKRFRAWWKNFQTAAPVTLRLAGKNVTGQATALTDEAALIARVTTFLENNPQDAKYYGLAIDEHGKFNPDSIRALVSQIVVIQVTLDD